VTHTNGISRYSGGPNAERADAADRDCQAAGAAPLSAKVALWLTVGIAVVTTVALLISDVLLGDAYWGGFAVAFFGGPLIAVAYLIALCAGCVGFVASLRQRSRTGVCMSLAPYIVAAAILLLLR
jgi:hypothetical protein